MAVLNANYLKALLAEPGIAEYLPIAFDRICMHEFVLSGKGAKDKLGIKTLDIAKRHARPRRPSADRVLPAACGRGADDRADRDRDEGAPRPLRRGGPRDPRGGEGGSGDRPERAATPTPVRRLDEAGAAQRPVVRWRPDA